MQKLGASQHVRTSTLHVKLESNLLGISNFSLQTNHNQFNQSIMADHNTYLKYKRDTRSLVYWMVHASNNSIKATTAAAAPDKPPPVQVKVNTTGRLMLADFVPVARAIRGYVKTVPDVVYRLFQGVY